MVLVHEGFHHPTTLSSHDAARVDIPNAHLDHPNPHWCNGNCRTDPFFQKDKKPLAYVVCFSPIYLSSEFVKLRSLDISFVRKGLPTFLGRRTWEFAYPGKSLHSPIVPLSHHLETIGVDQSSKHVYLLRSLFDCSMTAYIIRGQ